MNTYRATVCNKTGRHDQVSPGGCTQVKSTQFEDSCCIMMFDMQLMIVEHSTPLT